MRNDFESCEYGQHVGFNDLLKEPQSYVNMKGMCFT